ncbi:hypothetical protein T484DRAFT_1762060 [Baffinella frigidus]|nr:hypothetical protein T484DRAFT_1762060 [Cryptophyta sp. CCMP2293]
MVGVGGTQRGWAGRLSVLLLVLLAASAVSVAAPADLDDDAADDALLERLLQKQQPVLAQKGSSKGGAAGAARRGKPAAGKPAAGTPAGTGKYRKESVDEESVRTQAHFQEAQHERIRVAERDGKPEEMYLAATEEAAGAKEWTVACDLGFYSRAYGVIAQCTPASPVRPCLSM